MKIGRKPKKTEPSSKLVLEEIIGLTTKNANGLASSVKNEKCVYMAGYVAVVYNVDSGSQSHLMVSHRMPKPLNCVAVSQDGRFVAAGESGHHPAVLVWDSATLAFISELKGHQYGVVCTAFSPNGKHLVSVGFPHDGYICLWDWQRGLLVAKLKSSSSCSAIASVNFSSDGKFIVTAGKKHLKFWTVGSSTRDCPNTGTGSMAMHGKPVNLGHKKGSTFTSVTSPIWAYSNLGCGEQTGELFPIYALTNVGVLCVMDSGLSIQKSVDLKVEKGFALSASDKLIACACSKGIVQLFTIETLEYAGSLQYSESKICQEANNKVCDAEVLKKKFQLASTLPDAIACQFSTSRRLVVVYGDHSLHIWDIHDVKKATRCCVLVSHSASIWDIKSLSCENRHDPSLACVARGCHGGVSFATCSADGTIRLWDLALQSDILKETTPKLDKDHRFLTTEPVGTTHLVSAGILESDIVGSGVGKQGFRSMAVSSDGKYLAAGDCKGNLHIYDLHTSDYTCFQDAHDAEILSLSFNLPNRKDDITSQEVKSHYFLASGGRDRLIHLYDVERNFDLVGSVDDHSASVTSVKLASNGSKILSCSADRSLVFRDVAVTASGCKISRRHHQMASHGTVYDMAVDPKMEVAITVGQDKKINAFNIGSGKLIKSLKQDGDLGDPIKVTIDPSCSYLVCSYSNKSICMYDFITGDIVAQELGHSEVITGIIFLPDCKHIISVGGDGCIFVWKLPSSLSSRMLQRMKESSAPLSPASMLLPVFFNHQTIFHEGDDHQCKIRADDKSLLKNFIKVSQRVHQEKDHQEASAFRFSISRLPKWAQSKVTSSINVPGDAVVTSSKQVDLKIFSPIVSNGGGYVSVCPEVQTPPKHDAGDVKQSLDSIFSNSSDTDNSLSSPLPPETLSSIMGNRWLTIHTVCLDLLNSPETWDLEDMRMPVSTTHLLHNTAVETSSNEEHKEVSEGRTVVNHFSQEPSAGCGNAVVDDKPNATLSEHPRSNTPGSRCENSDQLCTQNITACYEAIVSEASAQLRSNTTESRVQTNLDLKSQDNDLFNQHFGNLSTIPKTEGRKSSGRRRYSARFVVRRDHLGGSNRLFEASIKELGSEALDCWEESPSYSKFKDPSNPEPKEPQLVDCFQQDMKNSPQSLVSPSHTLSQSECIIPTNSTSAEVRKIRDQKDNILEGTEVQEPIIACKKALCCLDAAAESALQLFSNMGNLISREETSSGPEAHLYDDAAELLPSIAEKVNAIAKLVQSSKNSSCGKTRMEVSSLEPLLGTFAENLTQRVVEILKNNLNTLDRVP